MFSLFLLLAPCRVSRKNLMIFTTENKYTWATKQGLNMVLCIEQPVAEGYRSSAFTSGDGHNLTGKIDHSSRHHHPFDRRRLNLDPVKDPQIWSRSLYVYGSTRRPRRDVRDGHDKQMDRSDILFMSYSQLPNALRCVGVRSITFAKRVLQIGCLISTRDATIFSAIGLRISNVYRVEIKDASCLENGYIILARDVLPPPEEEEDA